MRLFKRESPSLPGTLLLVFFAVSILALLAFNLWPKRYKVQSIFSVHASYFQMPLLSEGAPPLNDPNETSARLSSLFEHAADERFLESLQLDLGLTQSGQFRKSIEFRLVNPTTVQISTFGSTALQAFEINQRVFNQLIQTLYESRKSTLLKIKNALENNLTSFSSLIKKGGGFSADSKTANQGLYSDLVRKLNDLNVLFEMEKDRSNLPYLTLGKVPAPASELASPRVSYFVWGALLVMVFASMGVLFNSYFFKKNHLTPTQAAEMLNVPLLGVLPPFLDRIQLRPFESPSRSDHAEIKK